MALHSPSCETFLAELLTAPTGSVDHRLADTVLHLPEGDARDLLIAVMDDDHGTHAADIAHQIWHRAAQPTDTRGDAMTRAGIDYLKDLLNTATDPLVRAIAERVWTLSMSTRDEILDYLTDVMTDNPPNSRAFEVAREIWWLMGERGVAA